MALTSRWIGRIVGACVTAACLVSRPALADDEFEKFKRAAEEGVADIQQEFRSAVAAQDREFADHLRTQWAEFEAFAARKPEIGPKPRALPVAPRRAPSPSVIPRSGSKPSAAVQPRSDLIVKAPGVAAPPTKAVEVPSQRSVDRPPAPAPVVPVPEREFAVPGRISEAPRAGPVIPPVTPEARPDVAVAPAAPPVPAARPVPAPAAPRTLERTPPTGVASQTLSIDFFGAPVKVVIDPAWRTLPPVQTNPDGLADFWDRMSGTRFQPTLDAIEASRRAMALDDWGHALLWQEVTKALRPTAPREQLLLQWFFLVKSGFDARPGYSAQRLLLLVNVQQSVYGVSYIKVDGKPYYELFGVDPATAAGRYAAYSGRYPTALRAMDIRVAATGFVAGTVTRRALEFDNRGKRVRVDLAYERPVTRYLDRFPQLDFELYFATPPSPAARRSLAEALGPHLKGLSQEEGVDFLLAFVQKAFEYKTDKDQFGREKYFFVEEVLHFPYSDCEDRSAIFSWLVRELLGIDTVGLHYPGHMTTAVALSAVRADWQTVEWRNKRYVIADPTYINASVGMAMPSYRGQKPLRVVELY